jgi:hypothetical protein
MSMIDIVQQFLNQVSHTVNDGKNPLGLSAGQIDEINQILHLIKNIISDGIQRGDLIKMVGLMGAMAEALPELSGDIKEIIQSLKKLSKQLFDTPGAMEFQANKKKPPASLLNPAHSLLMDQEIGERGLLTDDTLLEELTPHDDALQQGEGAAIPMNPARLAETREDRSIIAEKILAMVNDHFVLSQANFNALTNGLSAIKRRASQTSQFNEKSHKNIAPPAPTDPTSRLY